jgi:hypothetical protein
MAFDNPDFGRKNYEEYLRAAKETLGVEHLTDDDRWIIERGIYYLIQGNDLLKREDPESLREAAWLFLAGAYYLGSRCAVSISEKIYCDLKSHGPGGKRGPKRVSAKCGIGMITLARSKPKSAGIIPPSSPMLWPLQSWKNGKRLFRRRNTRR